MSRIQMSKAAIGMVLEQDIRYNRALLCKQGTRLNATLINALKKFNIGYIEVIEDDLQDLSFDNLTGSLLHDLSLFNIDKVVEYCRHLVDSLLVKEEPLLCVLHSYDTCTFQHSINVACLAAAYAIKQKYTYEQIFTLTFGGLLHDIGKLKVPLEILNKPGKLEKYEFEVIQKHPYDGYMLLSDNPQVSLAVKQIVYQHHENYDGSGYPRGLTSSTGYILAQLTHVCDAYEALCAERPYKKALPRVKVREILYSGSGSQFNPILLKSFLEYIPLYLVGEMVYHGDKAAIVLNNETIGNPKVSFNNEIMLLSEFEELCDGN